MNRMDKAWSYWEMFWPCVSLLGVSALGGLLGTGLDLLFRR